MPNDTLAPRSAVIASGELLPDFTLDNQNREKWSLAAALKNGDVVLSFFPFAFTGVCATEMACITKEMSQFTAKGSQVVGVSCDSPFVLKAWAEQLGLTQPLLSDQHRQISKAVGLYWPEMNAAWRGTVIIGKDGKVKWSQKREIPKAFTLDEVLAHMS